jgi:flagellar biogenesis protein FliO
VYLPADPAIPAAGVGPTLHFTAHFLPDKQVLQREAVGGSISLQRTAYGLALALAVVWVASLAWGLRRLDTQEPRAARRRQAVPVRAATATR